jgi:hypothetical protein
MVRVLVEGEGEAANELSIPNPCSVPFCFVADGLGGKDCGFLRITESRGRQEKGSSKSQEKGARVCPVYAVVLSLWLLCVSLWLNGFPLSLEVVFFSVLDSTRPSSLIPQLPTLQETQGGSSHSRRRFRL